MACNSYLERVFKDFATNSDLPTLRRKLPFSSCRFLKGFFKHCLCDNMVIQYLITPVIERGKDEPNVYFYLIALFM